MYRCRYTGVAFFLLVIVVYATGTDDQKATRTHYSSSTVMAMNTMFCQGRVVPKLPNAACCGADSYNNEIHLCCDGIIKRKRKSLACCGIYLYNTIWYMCCDSQVVRKVGSNACCGYRPYNTNYEICCDGQVFSKRLNKSCTFKHLRIF